MPDRVSIITRLIIDRPTCLDCLATKSGITVYEVGDVLKVIAGALKVYYRAPGSCLICEEMKDVASVRSSWPRQSPLDLL